MLAVKLLGLKIRQEPACTGILLPNNQVGKNSQFADDTTITNSNNTISFVFGYLSGLKLNKKKTKAMWLGSMKQSGSRILNFTTTNYLIKVLGAFESYNQGKKVFR